MIPLMLILFVVTLLIGVPIFLCIGGTTILPYLMDESFTTSGSFLTRLMIGGVDSTPMLALPLFVLSGVIMGFGGISERIFNVFALIVGKRRAGIPISVVMTACMYGAICGAGAPAAAAVGAMAIPMLIELGYSRQFSASLVAAGGGIGLIIPPSIGYVMYGSLTGTSVGALFTAGFIPGLLIGFCLMVYCYIYCRIKGEDREKVAKNYRSLFDRGVGNVLKESIWAVLAPVIILGCIYGGITTPTEAAVISVWYALFICVFLYKTINMKNIYALFREAVGAYSGMILIALFGMGLTRVFTILNMPAKIGEFMSRNFSQQWMALLIVLLILLFIGMFMDVMPTIIILSPILYPVIVTDYGVNPVHFGIILTTTVALGLITPPYGLNIFVTAGIAGIDAGKMFRQCILFSGVYLVAMLLIAYIPAISLSLGMIFETTG
jgi:C4-dicarboxylate transporter DctM subunit